MEDDKRLLKQYNWEHPFPLTLKVYNSRPPSEMRYAVALAHNSAQHAWNYLVSIWDMIDEEMVAHFKFRKEIASDLPDLKFVNELSKKRPDIEKLKDELNIEKIINRLSSPEATKRMRCAPVHVTSFYIYARIFLDRSAFLYPVLTSNRRMIDNRRKCLLKSLPDIYYWLEDNKTEDDLPYFQILEKHWSDLNEKIIGPRNILITHAISSTEQFRMGGGETPKIRYEIFSLEDENFMLELLKKHGDLIGDSIAHPKKDIPNTINKLIEQGDKLDSKYLVKLMKIKNKMIGELPAIGDSMESVDSFRLELDRYYSSLIDKGILVTKK